MKNFICMDLTKDPHQSRIDDNAYVATRISAELEAQLEEASSEAFHTLDSECETNIRSQRKNYMSNWKYWVGIICCLPIIAAAISLRRDLPDHIVIPMTVISLVCCVVGAVLLHMANRDTRRAMSEAVASEMDFDLDAHMKKFDELSERAQKELAVPRNALDVDVLPFSYKRKGDKIKNYYPSNKFDNQPMAFWRQGGALMLSNGRVVFHIPEEDIQGRVTYAQSFTVCMWLKPTRYDQGEYQKYRIKAAGLLACRAHTYYGIRIGREGGEVYELLIPCYDWPQIEKLISVKEINEANV